MLRQSAQITGGTWIAAICSVIAQSVPGLHGAICDSRHIGPTLPGTQQTTAAPTNHSHNHQNGHSYATPIFSHIHNKPIEEKCQGWPRKKTDNSILHFTCMQVSANAKRCREATPFLMRSGSPVVPLFSFFPFNPIFSEKKWNSETFI